MIWSLLGFRLAFHKAHRGTTIVWIGGHITIERDRVIISILENKFMEFLSLVEEILTSNVVAIRTVRTLAGKANHFASILYVWRSFMSELWCIERGRKSPATRAMLLLVVCGSHKKNFFALVPGV